MSTFSTTSQSRISTKDNVMESSRTPNKLEENLTPAKLEGKLESRLTKDDLRTLQQHFDEYKTVNQEEFCRILGKVNKGTQKEYTELYERVDVTKEGLIDWNKFASHMLLDFYEKDDRDRSTQVPQWKDLKHLPSAHKEIIQGMSFMQQSSRYVTISKEGCVSLWDLHMRLQRTLKTGTDTCKARDLWVTSFVLLQNINKIALSFTSKEIAFYDISTKNDFTCQYKIHGLYSTPLSLDYWYNLEDSDEAILVWGDTGGVVNAIHFTSVTVALFQRPTAPAGEKHEPCLNICLKELLKNKYRNAAYSRHEGHLPSSREKQSKKDSDKSDSKVTARHKGHSEEWVRQVKYSQHLECFISCSTTSKRSLVIGWMEKHNHGKGDFKSDNKGSMKTIQKTSHFDISQGVNAFDYHESLNLIATAGVNHHVCLWNPYVHSESNGVLRGHMASVVQVQFNKSRGQLMSFSKDKVLRIWDVQLQVCISRISGMFPKGPEVHSILLFDEVRNRLFITFNYQLTMLEMRAEMKDRVLSHDKPVVQAIYNSTYNQVISADQGGTVIIWMLDSGQKAKQINQAHGQSELTCLTQDYNQTRLLTASTDGIIKIWDMNGHCYHSLQVTEEGHPADVGQILVLKHTVLAVGWAKYIAVFRNQAFKDFHVLPADWKGGQEHQDDILALSFAEPNSLASGSYDGEIIIWNNTSEQVSRRLTHRCRRQHLQTSREFRQGHGSRVEGASLERSPTTMSKGRMSRISMTSEDPGEYSHAVTRLFFLKEDRAGFNNGGTKLAGSDNGGPKLAGSDNAGAKLGGSDNAGANLVSCGGNGWVRFWNTAQSRLMAEFLAHTQVSSILMAVDEDSHWMATGDTDGLVKVWHISDYCVYPSDGIITTPPRLQSQFSAHNYTITSVELCKRSDLNNRVLVLTASFDCSVALWDIYGNRIGVFGQEEHWKIEAYTPEVTEDNQSEQEDEDGEEDAEVRDAEQDAVQLDDTRVQDPSLRINIWNNTLLGKKYKEQRTSKRERPALSTIPNLPYLTWERTGQAPTGPFAALSTSSLSQVATVHKPDFMANPHKYFMERTEPASESPRLPRLAESLEAPFDERTLFPGYILDFEANMRNHHQKLLKEAQEKVTYRLLKTTGVGNMAPSRNNSAKAKAGRVTKLKAVSAKNSPIREEASPVS